MLFRGLCGAAYAGGNEKERHKCHEIMHEVWRRGKIMLRKCLIEEELVKWTHMTQENDLNVIKGRFPAMVFFH